MANMKHTERRECARRLRQLRRDGQPTWALVDCGPLGTLWLRRWQKAG